MKINNTKLIYFIVGEPSGDLHASNLLKQINISVPGRFQFRGIGGPLMQQQGFVSVADFNRLSVMGFSEVLKELYFFINLKKLILSDIKQHNPSKIILVDYPGFNLKIARSIKKKFNFPVFYYISPQLWAWKESRVNIIKKYVDSLIVLFPFEVDWYYKRGVEVKYFGHPLIDVYKQKHFETVNSLITTVGIFPGSRSQEINQHVPVLKKVIAILKKKNKKIRFILGLASGVSKNIAYSLGLDKNYQIIKNNSLLGFHKSDVAIVASGTATLECALTKTPCVVIYKTSTLSWIVASLLIKVKFVSIVNILAKKLIVFEFVQNLCRPELIVKKISNLLSEDNKIYHHEINKVIGSLGDGNSYYKTTKYILNSDHGF